LGQLIYESELVDPSAYSPGKLALSATSDVTDVVADTNNYMRQVKLRSGLLDIVTLSNSFRVDVSRCTGGLA
jgi:hypothetical protein